MTVSAIAVPSVAMRVASHGGTRPPCSGRSAMPERFTRPLSHLGMAPKRVLDTTEGDIHGTDEAVRRNHAGRNCGDRPDPPARNPQPHRIGWRSYLAVPSNSLLSSD